ncbi:LdpA C-terminal domain-containing domain [Leptolyngbya sp. FACHB-711]|uniref:circadian clock protein LdpA n=1 Tax=unclassified Leptolyngbya TaxID=2650499 RepID=UPI0016898315|nr:4Fe-4S ferredoxin [Cyanobacteria bacterium FACHB-502]MBD2026260.1 4Fe-4S ferredoxin [Leptolyngbya sp. FACHB-711]
MTDLHRPLRSLRQGNWFKLICGASYQHLPAVRTLALAYALAGADCIDVAADPAVIHAAQSALESAMSLQKSAQQRGFLIEGLPWLMVSLNDGEDPHFRKAEFDPACCPPDCTRPCETVCPAQAIVFSRGTDRGLDGESAGVIDDQCYGCGRCVPICPFDRISTRSYVFSPAAVAPLVLSGVDAVEIHTQVGRLADFKRLWQAIEPFLPTLKLIAISCPDGEGFVDYLWALHEVMAPLPCALVWQTDGRPMSGDIGNGATLAAVKLGQKALAAKLPGYIQLAGGTNYYTVSKLKSLGLLSLDKTPNAVARNGASSQARQEEPFRIAGIAYGSYARTLLAPILEQLEQSSQQFPLSTSAEHDFVPFHSSRSEQSFDRQQFQIQLEDSDLLWQAVQTAHTLVSQIKQPMTAFAPSG